MTDSFDSAEMSSASRRVFMASSRAQWVEECTALKRCPTAAPGPHEARASEESFLWVAKFGLVSGGHALAKVRGIRCGSCAAHAYPQAPAEVVSLAAKLISWLFLFVPRAASLSRPFPRDVASWCLPPMVLFLS